ncbi:hypothetical protein A3800_14225 [Streptomyces badius]|nr:hypothetical protein A3838_14215 [Streptomyces badius]RAN26084.1 hypothetical protein A3800_14225 [Streptomyces badius]
MQRATIFGSPSFVKRFIITKGLGSEFRSLGEDTGQRRRRQVVRPDARQRTGEAAERGAGGRVEVRAGHDVP